MSENQQTPENTSTVTDQIKKVFDLVATKENQRPYDPENPIICEEMIEVVSIWKQYESEQELTDDQKIRLNEIYVSAYKK